MSDTVREALKRLEYAASEVVRVGDLQGSQWVYLTQALLTAKAALPQPAQPEGWRSMDSAPKDGAPVLIARRFDGVTMAHWGEDIDDDDESCEGWIGAQGMFVCGEDDPATHWRPLPAPPTDTAPREGDGR